MIDRNIAASIESDLSSVLTDLINVSNRVYAIDPDHPFLDEITSAIMAVESMPIEDLYEESTNEG